MNNTVIKADHLGKSYVIGHGIQRERYVALRDVMAQNAMNVWNKTKDLFQGKPIIEGDTFEEVWALKDVSFEIKAGEFVGIIGRNGAGKSTLLKVLSRITEPSAGRVILKGKVVSLLEVGTGFHPELTGRENIYLNGAILGMKHAEIKRKFDEIVDFSGVEKYLDTPIKRYSSGMYVRLAFAVASHLEPDILVVDEVLAVGDIEFQKKCMGKMQKVSHEGRTVLFVSHNMGAIESLCERAIWLDRGKVMSDGAAGDIVQQYLDSANTNTEGILYSPKMDGREMDLVIERMVLKNNQGKPVTTIASGEKLCIEVYYNALKRLPKPFFWLAIGSRFGFLFGANMLFDDARPEHIEGHGMISCTFDSIRLLPQTYTIRLGVRHQDGNNNYIGDVEINFSVTGSAKDLGMKGEAAHSHYEVFYPMLVPYQWHLPDGRIVPVNGFRTVGGASRSREEIL